MCDFIFRRIACHFLKTYSKKAIKDNYTEKNRFRFELNFQQVKNITELLRPIPQFYSGADGPLVTMDPAPALEPRVQVDLQCARELQFKEELMSGIALRGDAIRGVASIINHDR